MFKKLLSLLSLSVLAATPMAVVSCSNDNLSYSITDGDLIKLKEISSKFNNVELNENISMKELFEIKFIELKKDIFNIFKSETNYLEKEYASKLNEFNKYNVQLNYFSYDYDIENINHDEFGYYWKMTVSYKEDWSPVWENDNLKDFSLKAMSLEWEKDSKNWEYIKNHIFISFGKLNGVTTTQSIDEKPYWDGIIINTKFE